MSSAEQRIFMQRAEDDDLWLHSMGTSFLFPFVVKMLTLGPLEKILMLILMISYSHTL
jgi:hypothetical protein